MQRALVHRHRQAAAQQHVCAISCSGPHVYIQRQIHVVPALALQFCYSGNNTSCALETSSPAACRKKRRKLLNQHRLVWRGIQTYQTHTHSLSISFHIHIPKTQSMCTGAASRQSVDLECGQFDEAFVEALKGTGSISSQHMCLYFQHGAQPRPKKIASYYASACSISMNQFRILEDHIMVHLISNAATAEPFFGAPKELARTPRVLRAQLSTTSAAKEAESPFRGSCQDLSLQQLLRDLTVVLSPINL